ncbi:radial spoke head 10 homolog B-like isoform X2 [Octopus sinensis]|uniref:Radial spoke head 10 homolog B-like isoform X2 n=1 Tax=Octopus sinensis TaxID=2607531 RepID=A0A7E6FHM8_9MOLL|nr:radial spoke head 10 homolog B-like isoform X2 [Octopus sinensis]
MARKKVARRTDEILVTEEEKTELSSWENEEVEETEQPQPPQTQPQPQPPQPAETVEEEAEVTTSCVTEGPLLTNVVIKTYDGRYLNGLFEGEGCMEFIDGHIYKGFFHQGLMHGHGYYEWDDGVIYEGDFMFNYITGKGTYTYLDGSTYEGEVLNGKRHGYGIYTWKAEGKCYAGYWFKGKKHGKGCMQFDKDSQCFYHGDWRCDLPHGWGLQRYSSHNIYEGFWFKNKPNVDGVMKWFVQGRPKDVEIYKGHWSNGIQQGYGEQVWVTYRAPGSQFNGQNLYRGNFVNGKRHGQGTFYYADGSKYKGEWFEDMKHGFAKFTQRTGDVYEGRFENNALPDNTFVTGLPALINEQDSKSPEKEVHMKTVDNNFMMDVNSLLKGVEGVNPERELIQVNKNVWRHIGFLKKIYLFYASLGQEPAIDNVYLMDNLQFWRFLKDCCLHHHGFTLMEMDRFLGNHEKVASLHDPFGKLLLREFIASLVVLAYKAYGAQYEEAKAHLKYHFLLLDWCFNQLLKNNIYPNVFTVKGHIFTEVRRAMNIMEHIQEVYKIYTAICKPRKLPPHDASMKMRDCLVILKDLNLINENLTAKAAIDVLAVDDPNVIVDGDYNLEMEMTYLEFLEALVGFAEIYITETVVESLTIPLDTVTSSRSPKTSSQPVMSPVLSTNVSTISFQQQSRARDTTGTRTPEAVQEEQRTSLSVLFSPLESLMETTDSRKTTIVTEDLLRKRAEHNNCEIATLEEVSLHQQDIERIENIDKWCRDLKILYLQCNLIPKIEHVNRLKKLEYLNLALNNIERIENIEGCESLRKLDLTVNFVGEITSIKCLRNLVHFNELYLIGNPCADFDGYQHYVIVILPNLKILDGKTIEKSERILAMQNFKATEEKILRQQEEYLQKRKTQKEEGNSKNNGKESTTLTEENNYDDDSTSHSLEQSTEEVQDDDNGKTEEELEKEFWDEKVPFTPESRIQVHEHMRKLKEKEDGTADDQNLKKPRRLFNDEGRAFNMNEPKINFTLKDQNEENAYLLDMACYKFLDPQLIDVDVQPLYVRATIKGKIFQLSLNEEVNPDRSTAKRSQTTGHLLITMPKMKPIIKPTNRKNKRQEKKNEEPKPKTERAQVERLEVGENLTKVDYCNIINENNQNQAVVKEERAVIKKWSVMYEDRKNSEDFVDDPEVPELI